MVEVYRWWHICGGRWWRRWSERLFSELNNGGGEFQTVIGGAVVCL